MIVNLLLIAGLGLAQQAPAPPTPPAPPAAPAPPSPPAPPPASQGGLKPRDEAGVTGAYVVAPGTRILLSMVNSVSTKQAAPGDRIYLQTAFPVTANGRIVIPQGSWVAGTVTAVRRPGRGFKKGEMQVRFDSLTLANGVTRDFRADLGSLDPNDNTTLHRENSTVQGGGRDAGVIVGTAAAGTLAGATVGAIRGSVGQGVGIGAGAGLAAGLVGTLLTRGPDPTLQRGSSVEMVLDRPLSFSPEDLDVRGAPAPASLPQSNSAPRSQRRPLIPRPY